MNCDKDIFKILSEAKDEGISAMNIACHVYNSYNSFFDDVDFDVIYHYVSNFLKKNSKNPDSIIEKSNLESKYYLNFNSRETQQLMFEFENDLEDNENQQNHSQDFSLSLFDE